MRFYAVGFIPATETAYKVGEPNGSYVVAVALEEGIMNAALSKRQLPGPKPTPDPVDRGAGFLGS